MACFSNLKKPYSEFPGEYLVTSAESGKVNSALGKNNQTLT